ncbi:MAG: L,D-transpeptidase family protein [Legionellales bacterium]|jgi:L,D-transpeptidase ErfK/SrfK|nr:L,D-transpeptidase family protein [Legionellales bacterium]
MKKYILLYLHSLISVAFAVQVDITGAESNKIIGLLKSGQVEIGETISAISRRYNVGYDEVIDANPNLNLATMVSGDVLVIPSKHMVLARPHKGIVVNLPEKRMYHYKKGLKEITTYPVGVGEIGWDTPMGAMTIIGKRKNPTWYVPNSVWEKNSKQGITLPKVVAPGLDNPLGSRAMRLSSPSYLIHGTNEPEGVGQRSTAGCISLYPEDIVKLYKNTPIDTLVTVVDEDLKWYVSSEKICVEVHNPLKILGEQGKGLKNDDRRKMQRAKFMYLASKYSIVKKDQNYWKSIQEDLLGVPQCVLLEKGSVL